VEGKERQSEKEEEGEGEGEEAERGWRRLHQLHHVAAMLLRNRITITTIVITITIIIITDH